MSKLLYIIPGISESTKNSGYKKIISSAKKHGYIVIPINILWDKTTMTNWIQQFESIVKKHRNKNAVALGFSFGAYIVAVSAQQFNFKKIILCSLSPYFKRDLKYLPLSIYKAFGKRRMEDFENYSFPKNMKVPIVFMIGTNDFPLAIKRIKEYYKKYNGEKSLHLLKKVEHNISDSRYIKEIENELKK